MLRARGYGYEPGTVREAEYALSLLDIKDGPTIVLDIGANDGDYTAAILKLAPHSSIHAFEPSPAIATFLTARFQNDERVAVHQFGLSNHIGKVQLYSNNFAGKMSSLVKRNLSHLNVQFDLIEEITVTTLRDWCASAGVKPHVLKIDVEGFEFQVLEGAGDMLSFVKVIQFEFGGTNVDSRVFFRDFWDILTKAEFEIFRLTPKGLAKINNYSESQEIFVYSNFYARSTITS